MYVHMYLYFERKLNDLKKGHIKSENLDDFTYVFGNVVSNLKCW
jgi:hypothetical protein